MMRRCFVVPFRFHSATAPTAAAECRDDRIYWIDDEGHVHAWAYLGRLVDMPPGPDVEYEDQD